MHPLCLIVFHLFACTHPVLIISMEHFLMPSLNHKKITQVVKEMCAERRMNEFQCLTFIDEEVLKLFTGDGRMTASELVDKRSILDALYNATLL